MSDVTVWYDELNWTHCTRSRACCPSHTQARVAQVYSVLYLQPSREVLCAVKVYDDIRVAYSFVGNCTLSEEKSLLVTLHYWFIKPKATTGWKKQARNVLAKDYISPDGNFVLDGIFAAPPTHTTVMQMINSNAVYFLPEGCVLFLVVVHDSEYLFVCGIFYVYTVYFSPFGLVTWSILLCLQKLQPKIYNYNMWVPVLQSRTI